MTTLLDSRSGRVDPPSDDDAVQGNPMRRRIAVAAMLAATAVFYIWNLGASGYGNTFYAAAVQSGTKSWKAFLFGSSDWGNSITVDKPPASLWPMEISGRIFGFNSWSMLIPEALMGVAAVGLLYLTVKRWFGTSAGFIAGGVFALTPVAVLMFRFNNPDALLTLLIVAAAYCVTRALDQASTTWLILAGVALGFSFLAKSLQGFTVVPGFALMYLVAAPTSLRRRILQMLAAGVAIVISAGWWIAIVAFWPASSRPYIGGSTNNSALELAFGYNGLGRITGNEGGSGFDGGGGGGGVNFSGPTGLFRLFNSEMGGQISWLIPAALISLVALAVISGKTARTDRTRAAIIMWGGWLLVTGLVLSFASGTIHSYYTIELAPAIAALVAIGSIVLWRRRSELRARLALALGVLATGIWTYDLLQRDSSWQSWLRFAVAGVALLAVAALVIGSKRWTHTLAVGAVAGLIVVGGGSSAYALSTASTAQTSPTPSAGPASAIKGGFGGFGGFGGSRPAGDNRPAGADGGFGGAAGGTPATGAGSGGAGFGGGMPPNGIGAAPTGPRAPAGGALGTGGGLGGSATANSALVALLKASETKWSAATIGSQTAATFQLASDTAVMPIGGFIGSDNSPTLAQFKELVAKGEIHYFISGGGFGGRGGGEGGSTSITSWVESSFTSSTVGTTTVYDLTSAASS